jgi:hypothetical protein
VAIIEPETGDTTAPILQRSSCAFLGCMPEMLVTLQLLRDWVRARGASRSPWRLEGRRDLGLASLYQSNRLSVTLGIGARDPWPCDISF